MGGDAGAEGRLLLGRLVLRGLLGVRSDLGRERRWLFRLDLRTGLGGKGVCLGIWYELIAASSSESVMDMKVGRQSSSMSMSMANETGGDGEGEGCLQRPEDKIDRELGMYDQ